MAAVPITERTPAELVEIYIQLRDRKKAANEEFKKSMERTNEAMEKLEAILLGKLQDLGADSLSCGSGTVYRNTEYSATVQDKEAFRSYIESTGDWSVADIRANKTVVKDMLNSGQEVPGVKFSSMFTVGVRRA